MVYDSLFDKITNTAEWRRQQKYNGTLDGVLNQVRESLVSRRDELGIIHLVLYPPRIIRAFVGYKIQNPDKQNVECLLRDAIHLGLDIYRQRDTALQELEELRRKIIDSENKAILYKELIEENDVVTWRASMPTYSITTAIGLAEKKVGKHVLFIALAYGGIAAGMDTYLRYCDELRDDNSIFYVVRFSINKLDDAHPQLSPAEEVYLKEQLIGKRLIIFDEDVFSEKTLQGAQRFFAMKLLPAESAIVVTNL